MPVCQLVWLPVGYLGEANLRFGADSNKLDSLADCKFLDFATHTRVDDNRAGIESCSGNTCHNFAGSLTHSTCQHHNWSRLDELKSISDFTDAEVGIFWVVDSDKFCWLAQRDHHIMQAPELHLVASLFLLGDKGLSEYFLEFSLIIQFFNFHELLFLIGVLLVCHVCSRALRISLIVVKVHA